MIRKIRSSLLLLLIMFVFFVMTASAFIMAFLAALLMSFNLISFAGSGPKPIVGVCMLLMTSVFLGTFISTCTADRILRPILQLNKATIQVAKGDFGVELDVPAKGGVVRDLAINFNKMVRELRGIETLQNDFIVNVSHEFKTPIAAIEGYATLLGDDSLTADEQSEYTRKIIGSVRQLSSLTDNILKLSKLENQEIVVEKESFRLDEQIRQALVMLEPAWSGKNLELGIELDTAKYCWNEELLMQVWVNLLSNAIKFTPENGTIMVILSQTEKYTSVIISDTGIGMKEEALNQIFDKFYQGDKARYVEGNGLGLTLVKRIIDLCGGTIDVKSEIDKGTTFTVTLINHQDEKLLSE